MTAFENFFETATGYRPYAYQRKFSGAGWPEVLIAPTGLGKTAAVVIGWLWRRRHAADETPRRLVYCLPMRTLVEQTAGNTRAWIDALARVGESDGLPAPRDVHVLLGGADEPRWYDDPDRPAILIGTQDMLVSRALMRGYAMSRFRWPVDFALLHNDAQWVFDEVQLMGAAIATSTQLHGFRAALGTHRPVRSLWVSATLDPAWLRTVDLPVAGPVLTVPETGSEDAADLRVLALIQAPKPLAKAPVAVPGSGKRDLAVLAAELAAFVSRVHRAGSLTLVIVNTVARAQAVHAALTRDKSIDASRLILLHSRFRPGDRSARMEGLRQGGDRIVVATQAVEAGVDISAAVMVTELAPWPSLVQRFGRANRYGEFNDSGGAEIYWIDLLEELSAPYGPQPLAEARQRLLALADAAPAKLGAPGALPPPRHVIRQKDLIDLFDTDPDLTGFDLDVSPFVRDADDTDIRVFWRDLGDGEADQPAAKRDELCAVPIGAAKAWLQNVLKRQRLSAYYVDTQSSGRKAVWTRLQGEPWPGLTLMIDARAGGYDPERGFDPALAAPVAPVPDPMAAPGKGAAPDSLDGDPDSARPRFVSLGAHLGHVATEAERLCKALRLPPDLASAIIAAARWHDVGKAHEAFQARMIADDPDREPRPVGLLAKAPRYDRSTGRPFFRHELASALAYLAGQGWSRDADFVAYLIAAHHGKVRLSLRALPAEKPAEHGGRFARGVWEGDVLPAVDLCNGERWAGGALTLSVMELGEDRETGASWAERMRALLEEHGPFRLAWAEMLVRVADWRASALEQTGEGRSDA